MGLRAWVQRHTRFHTFTKFAFGGLASYVFNIALAVLLTEVLGVHYLLSFIISLTLTTLFNFILAIKFVFNIREGVASKLVLYVLSVIVMYFVNIQLVKWLVEGLGIHYLVSIIASTVTLFAVKFFIYDRFVFANERPKRKRA